MHPLDINIIISKSKYVNFIGDHFRDLTFKIDSIDWTFKYETNNILNHPAAVWSLSIDTKLK